MTRDLIDCLMAGSLLSFLPIWQTTNRIEQIATVLGLSTLLYILFLFVKKEEPMHTYKIVREDFHTGQCSKRIRRITRNHPLKIGGLYSQLGKGYPGTYRVLEEIYDPWEEENVLQRN